MAFSHSCRPVLVGQQNKGMALPGVFSYGKRSAEERAISVFVMAREIIGAIVQALITVCSLCRGQFRCALVVVQVDGDDLGQTLVLHCDAKQRVGELHAVFIVGDHDNLRFFTDHLHQIVES